ncbi:NADPH-dependent FMN reductase [Oricola cellulosilytica]|uniref:NADPH-dependent oxidoreductase n=1 Tax=Oricola cellulosilytica TaxID=1429082 RepID=A0A4V2MP57_9HYPH|nr:NAD(P)H-dependent oxidoreductase [Oricola cellulosilytica]TCD16392.1 NADPH-dependent oxidoreductase [Oricola cellulosilytica]
MFRKVLVFAGSTRSGSFNRQLAEAAMKTLVQMEADVTMISLADYPLPLVDEDLKKEKGVPENAVRLARFFASHDAAFIASPEYNSSIPPLLKNTIDWVSLVKSDGSGPVKPYAGLTIALGAASDGALGGIRGLYHLRSVLMNVGAQIVTEQCSVSRASKAFGEDGMLADERLASKLKSACRALLDHSISRRAR